MTKDLRYWDSDAFIGYLGQEPDKQAACMAVMKEAAAGKLLIVTSALTLAEVIKLRKHKPIRPEKRIVITEFFKHQYISVRNVNRALAEEARNLVWDYNVDPKDAIHVATALRFGIPRLETFDGGLHKLDGRLGTPPLSIGTPSVLQQVLDFPASAPDNE